MSVLAMVIMVAVAALVVVVLMVAVKRDVTSRREGERGIGTDR